MQADRRTAAVLTRDQWENGTFQLVGAFDVIMFSLLIVLVTISNIVGKRDGMQDHA